MQWWSYSTLVQLFTPCQHWISLQISDEWNRYYIESWFFVLRSRSEDHHDLLHEAAVVRVVPHREERPGDRPASTGRAPALEIHRLRGDDPDTTLHDPPPLHPVHGESMILHPSSSPWWVHLPPPLHPVHGEFIFLLPFIQYMVSSWFLHPFIQYMVKSMILHPFIQYMVKFIFLHSPSSSTW